MSRLVAITLTSLVMSTAGCGDVEPDTSVSQDGLAGNFGEVLFSYRQTFSDITEEEPAPFQITARFVRVRDLGWQEVRELWGDELPPTDVPLGECIPIDTALPRQDDVLSGSGSLELLDAGDLSLTIGEEELRVPRQSFPSVFGFAAGVEYEGEAFDMVFQPEREYRLLSSGSEEISSFDFILLAPEEFENLTVNGAEIGLEVPVVDSSDQPMEIRWEPSRETNEIFLELSMIQFGVEQHVVCHSPEDGVIEIPASIAAKLLEAGVSDSRLVIYRIARTAFPVEGLDEAEALFVVSGIVPLDVR